MATPESFFRLTRMLHYRSIESCVLQSSWITIGSFDGIHRGHQYLISKMVEDARKNQVPAVIITFSPHPSVFLQKINTPFYLTSLDEKLGYLEELGVDYVFTLDFNHELASMRAQEFISLLSQYLGLRSLWVGQGFALGKNREGNIPFLQTLGEQLHYELQVVEPLQMDGYKISSSLIRKLIAEGNVHSVKPILGRHYSIRGKVVPGDHRGRLLGIPTANLQTTSQRLLPANGIYATRTVVDGITYDSVTNVGIRPTFSTTNPVPIIESYILDFDRDIYNKTIDVVFIEFLRPEERYSELQALLNQIELDIQKTREVLKHEP